MLGAYYPGQSYPGQGPDTNIVVVLFGAICDTGLTSLSAVHRVRGLDGPRALAATAPLRALLGRGAAYALAGGTRRRVDCTHD